MSHIQQVLALDLSGQPFAWLKPEEAVTAYAKGNVAWDLGDAQRVFRGGVSRLGIQSEISVKPIIAIAGSDVMTRFLRGDLPLSPRDNELLFKRDRYTCAYCGVQITRDMPITEYQRKKRAKRREKGLYPTLKLTRDHIVPRAAGGEDTWMNCATACVECNGAKGSKSVHDFRPLLYVPYVPNRAEHFILTGRNILADQHEYLAAQLPKHSRLLLN
jgi:hypothetical protein